MKNKLSTIWIGDESKRPDSLIQTWKDNHPEWEYSVHGNDTLYGRTWKNQKLIDHYLYAEDYPGVADIMRYELLLEEGQFIHPADSVCLNPVDELLENAEIIAVYENETVVPGLISPVYYAKKGHPFVRELVDNLPGHPYDENGEYVKPWILTGNTYMRKTYEKWKWGFKPLPSYTFTPVHHSGKKYRGKKKIYAKQMWGSTFQSYGTDNMKI